MKRRRAERTAGVVLASPARDERNMSTNYKTRMSTLLHALDITVQNQEQHIASKSDALQTRAAHRKQEQHIASCILSSFRFIAHLGLDENPTRLEPRAYGPRCNRGDSGPSVQESGHHNAALARLRWSLELHRENIGVLFSCGMVSACSRAKGKRKFNIWNSSKQ